MIPALSDGVFIRFINNLYYLVSHLLTSTLTTPGLLGHQVRYTIISWNVSNFGGSCTVRIPLPGNAASTS